MGNSISANINKTSQLRTRDRRQRSGFMSGT